MFPRDGTLTGSQRLVKESARSLSEPVRYGRLTRSRHPQPAGTMGDALDRGREAAERGSSASDDRLILLREVAMCAPAWQHSGHSRHSNAFGSGTSGQNNLASARLLPARRGYNLAVGSDTGNSTSRNKHGRRKSDLNCRHAHFPDSQHADKGGVCYLLYTSKRCRSNWEKVDSSPLRVHNARSHAWVAH